MVPIPAWHHPFQVDSRSPGAGDTPRPLHDGGAPRLTVAAVARRLGVAPATLRTWDRRYGLGPGEHKEGSRRRYSPADLARLETMRRLVLEGVAPAEAAAAALRPGVSAPPAPPPGNRPLPSTGHGGRVLALPGASAAGRGLARAALALDDSGARGILLAHLRATGVTRTWDELLRPVLRALGDRWAATGEGVDSEHMLSVTVVASLREAVPPIPLGRIRPVLLASAEDEQHALPLHVLAAALAEQGVAAQVLGAALPAVALHAAVRRTGPAAVVVWAQLRAIAEAAGVDTLPVTRPAPAVFVGGPGWAQDRLPRRARLLHDLPSAVEELRAAVGA